MSGGFLGLAYIAEVSIVFNLAYSELRDRRYVECAEGTINVLRNKLGKQQMILRDHSDLYLNLDRLTDENPKNRNAAWSCCDEPGLKSSIYSWFLSHKAYPFFSTRKDREGAIWCCGLSVLVIIFSTLLDHFEQIHVPLKITPETYPYYWCTYLTILLACMAYPVATVFVGRKMMKRLDRVSSYLVEEFKKVVEPSLKSSISSDLEKFKNTIAGNNQHP